MMAKESRRKAARERVPSKEARARLTELMNRAAFHGERLVISKNGEDACALVGMDDLKYLESNRPAA